MEPIVTVFFTLPVLVANVRHGFLWEENPIWNDVIPVSPNLWVAEEDSRVTCAFRCFNDTSCDTFFYLPDTNECQGHLASSLDISQGTVHAAGARNYNVRCRSGSDYQYVREHDFCFRLYDVDDISWYDAQDDCKSRHGSLLQLETYEKAVWMIDYLNSLPSSEQHSFWLGMTDEVTEGVFVWSESGSIHPYSVSPWKELWIAGQPDNSNFLQHCAITRYKDHTYSFDDFKCTGNNKRHICQCDAA